MKIDIRKIQLITDFNSFHFDEINNPNICLPHCSSSDPSLQSGEPSHRFVKRMHSPLEH